MRGSRNPTPPRGGVNSRMIALVIVLATAAVLLLFAGGCGEGPMGPAGHTGSAGTDGLDGNDGTNGNDGTDGIVYRSEFWNGTVGAGWTDVPITWGPFQYVIALGEIKLWYADGSSGWSPISVLYTMAGGNFDLYQSGIVVDYANQHIRIWNSGDPGTTSTFRVTVLWITRPT